MRISKRVRNEAAMIAALGASSCIAKVCGYGQHHTWLMSSHAASKLASNAYQEVLDDCASIHYDWRAVWAEAEALLRTGWTPGGES